VLIAEVLAAGHLPESLSGGAEPAVFTSWHQPRKKMAFRG
jgi:hypothetical protein